MRGIDTSQHNGKITKAILNKVDFVIIRAGFGSDIKSQDDPEFENTVKLCEKYNKPWGAYLYSYAITVEDAISEAKHMQRLLKGKKPDMGIWFDMEDADGYKESRDALNKEMLVKICKTFCDITGAGIYASLSWFENILNDKSLDKYPKWVAQWNKTCDYKKPYVLWQYTDDLKIGNKHFDGNMYKGKISKKPKLKSNKEIAIEVLQNKWGSGSDRKIKISKAGYNYDKIQKIVNKYYQIADEVILGKYGNGNTRKNKLKKAGYDVKIIQDLVNSILG